MAHTQPLRIPRCEVAGCRNHTAEGVCVPCQQEHGLPGRPYRLPGKTSTPITKTAPTSPRGARAPRPPKPAPAAPERPQAQPHNLDAPGVREAPTGIYAAVLETLNSVAFFTPQCCWSESLIAEKLGVSRMTVVRAKRWLKANGWIAWERVWRPGQRWQNCVYTILAGWHRPHRKAVLKWLDRRRSRANVALNELQRRHAEKETERSRARRVRNPRFGPWQGWMRSNPPPKPAEVESIVISADFAARAGGRERAEAFATWTPYRVAA